MWQAYLPVFQKRPPLRYVPLAHPAILLGDLDLGFVKKERAPRFAAQRRAMLALGLEAGLSSDPRHEIRDWDKDGAGAGLVLPAPMDSGRGIPRKLFHIARDAASIPDRLRRNLDDLAAQNPGWVQKIWYDDEASDWVRATFPGRISDAFHRIAPQYGVCKADFLRYLLIWHFGGVYLDLKSRAARPLDEMIAPEDAYLLGTWLKPRRWKELEATTGGSEYVQWFLAARPGHPFLGAVITRLVKNIEQYQPLAYASGARAVICLTGPIAYSLAIHPLRGLHPHRMVPTEDEGWVYSIFDDEDAHRRLNPGHYGRQTALHVLPPPGPALRFRAEALVFHLINLVRRILRPLNHWRLERRRARKAARR